MKKVFFIVLAVSIFINCSDDDAVIEQVTESFEFSTDGTPSFMTDVPQMFYDTGQQATFITYDDNDLQLRLNFRGQDVGVYESSEAIFYQFSYDIDSSQVIDIICDTQTGIVINVTNYGAIGEFIEGDFSADNCDGLAGVSQVTGSFKVIREE